MAKILFGAMVTDARGKLAGIVYSKNAAGAYARQKVSPTQSLTTRRGTVRERVTNLSKYFSASLTPDQVAAWNGFAKNNPVTDIFGRSQTLSGITTFTRLNATIINVGGSQIDDPPPSLTITGITTMSVTANSGAAVVLSVVSGEAAEQRFTVLGNHVAQLTHGMTLTAAGVTGNAGPFTVGAAVLVGGNTQIYVDEAVVDVAAAGTLTTAGSDLVSVAFGPTPLDTNVKLSIWATQPLPPGRTFTKSFMRWLAYSSAAQASPYDVTAAYVAKFGSLVGGNKIGVRAQAVDATTGAATTGLYELATIQ